MTEQPNDTEHESQPSTRDASGMQFGVIAIIDALGFKGIWGRVSPQKVVDALNAVRREAQERAAQGHDGTEIHARFFSDTAVFAAIASLPTQPPWHEDDEKYYTLFSVMQAVAGAQACAALCDPPLVYRGCIAAGRILVAGDFILGEAVDEAAQWMEQADAGIVWLCPSAERLFFPRCKAEGMVGVPFDVPLHGGRVVKTLVVNPLEGSSLVFGKTPLADRMLSTFTGSVSVEIKKQHTARFFIAAEEHAEAVRQSEADLRKRIWNGQDPLRDPDATDSEGQE